MRGRKFLSRFLLAMSVLSVAMWAASYARFFYRAPNSLFGFQTGTVQVQFKSTPWKQRPSPWPDSVAYRLGWHYMGYRGLATRWWPAGTRRANFWAVHIPLWMPAVLFGASFRYVYPPYRRYKRRKRLGLCLTCGYDLTGNESGKCPECGTAVVPRGA